MSGYLPPSFVELLAPLAQVMTTPTFQSCCTLLAGWLLAGRRTVTGALKLAGVPTPKHFSSYHRVFSYAHWNLDALGLALLAAWRPLAGGIVYLAIDDTLCHHRGRHIWGAGMHYDPSLTSRALSNASRTGASTTLKRRGHAWVVLGLLVELPFFPGHWFCLPVFFRLYLNTRTAVRCRQRYQTRSELAVDLLKRIAEAFPQSAFHVLVDTAYAGKHLLQNRPKNCQVTARWIAHPALYGPAPAPRPGQQGRPRVRGPRLESVEALLSRPCPHVVLDVYGKHTTYRLASMLACFFATPGQLLQIVAAEPLSPAGRPQTKHRAVFYSTALDLTAAEIIIVYARRWSIEVAFHDAKGCLGAEDPQGTCRQSVQRHTPLLLLFYSLVVLWFARHGQRRWRPSRWPWYRAKCHPSFPDMLAALRQTTLRRRFRRIFNDPNVPRDLQKPFRTLLTLWKRAA